MSIDEELVLELISRVENERLDFKTYSYAPTTDGRLELAKDLMAIANGLDAINSLLISTIIAVILSGPPRRFARSINT